MNLCKTNKHGGFLQSQSHIVHVFICIKFYNSVESHKRKEPKESPTNQSGSMQGTFGGRLSRKRERSFEHCLEGEKRSKDKHRKRSLSPTKHTKNEGNLHGLSNTKKSRSKSCPREKGIRGKHKTAADCMHFSINL